MGLGVGVIGGEELLHSVDGALFDHVDALTAAVIPLARQAFSVLVRQRSPHRFEHGGRDEVLARDELETALLAVDLAVDERGDLPIGLAERSDRHSRSWRSLL